MAGVGHRPERTRVAAYAWVERDGAILLVRASERSDAAGSWFLPGGGIEWGEHPAEAVLRELREETGLDGAIRSLMAVDSDVVERADCRLHTVRICYRVDVGSTDLVTEVDGSTDLPLWVPLAHADGLPLMPSVRRIVLGVTS